MADQNRAPGAYDLLWGQRQQPRRGPKPALSLDAIVRVGIAIADAEGLSAISMQRIAAELGFTKMSLYRYVPGKAELVALMADTAVGRPPAVGDLAGWRPRLEAWARALLPGFLQHSWVLEVTVGPRIIGPNELAWMEQAVSALDGTGLRGAERMDAVVVLAGHVRNLAQQTQSASGVPHDDPEAQLGATLGKVLREHADEYPAVAAALMSVMEEGGQDNALDFGLERILDGLGMLIDRRTAAKPE